jgi:hypothetical protein
LRPVYKEGCSDLDIWVNIRDYTSVAGRHCFDVAPDPTWIFRGILALWIQIHFSNLGFRDLNKSGYGFVTQKDIIFLQFVFIPNIADAYHFDADPDPDFYLMRIRIRMRIQVPKMMRIRADPDPQHFKLYVQYYSDISQV